MKWTKEYKREYNKQYYQKNKKYREHKKEYLKKWREKNKNYNKKYRKEHKEQIKEYKKKYREDNKEYWKGYQQEHKEKIKEHNKKYMKQYLNKNPEARKKAFIRGKTNQKYGKLPKGYQYHHPEPYDIDNFEILKIEEHLKKRRNKT